MEPALTRDAAMVEQVGPACRPSTLDVYTNARALCGVVERAASEFGGVVLDVGCGRMPYKRLVMAKSGRVTRWIGLDLRPYGDGIEPDLLWDGVDIPLPDATVDGVLLTEVLEHCADPLRVMSEIYRVLKPGGFMLLTVPFVWPIHDVPRDEFRYTPYSLGRILRQAGFKDATCEATAGRHAMLATVLGLWVRRRDITSRTHAVSRAALSLALWPVIALLTALDRRPRTLGESTLLLGLSASARKPA